MAGELAAAQAAAVAVDTAGAAFKTALTNYTAAVRAAVTAGALAPNDASIVTGIWAQAQLEANLQIVSVFGGPATAPGPTFSAAMIAARLR